VFERRIILAVLTAVVGLSAGCRCSSSNPTSAPVSIPTEASTLSSRGKSVYAGNCISCHNPNPKLAGTVGPEVFGSSIALLEARLLKGTYPEGYKPKRPGAGMPVFPHLASDIAALHAFLNAP
jgi:mono/diheme cytochrome c family protein